MADKWDISKDGDSYKAVANRDRARVFELIFRGLATGDFSAASPHGLNPDIWIWPKNEEKEDEYKWYTTEAVWIDFLRWAVEKARAAGYTI